MKNVYIDPYLLACPSLETDIAKFENYISNLINWENLKTSTGFKLFALNDTYDFLYETNRYPLWEDLKLIIKRFDIDYIQPKDIVSIVDAILQKTVQLQEHLLLKDYLAEDLNFEPSLVQRECQYADKLLELTTLTSINCKMNGCREENQLIITKDFQKNEIRFSAKISLIEFHPAKEIVLPFTLKNNFSVIFNFSELLTPVSHVDLWKNATTNEDYLNAIVVSLNTYNEKNGVEQISALKGVSFGINFLKTLIPFNFDSSESKITSLLNTLNEIILNYNLKSTHQLRSGGGGDNEQIVCEGYKAWRKDIDYEFHVHYWKKENEIIIANLVPHNDFKITNI